jgi:hypothetical protein
VNDQTSLKANVQITTSHLMPNGNVIHETQEVRNLVVDAGLNLLRDRLAGTSSAYATHLAVGTGTTAASAAQTTMVTEVFRDALTSTTTASKAVTFKYYLASGSANGNTLQEIGLFTASSGGTMIARAVLVSPIVKTASVTVTFSWTINLSAS